MVGVAGTDVMVKAEELTRLAKYPEGAKIALMVSDELTAIGAVYLVDEVVGVVPLVV
jgi:hypothetical protein